jgi:Domain of unknown function DUF29
MFQTHTPISQSTHQLFDTDQYLWSQTNAQLLRQGKLDQVDLRHVIELVDALGKHAHAELERHVLVVLTHLHKLEHQPKYQAVDSQTSIRSARLAIRHLIESSPSLSSRPFELLTSCYAQSRRVASDETGLELATFPVHCPYTIDQILDSDWFPDRLG